MAGFRDRHVLLPLRSRNAILKNQLAALRHWIRITECGEKWFAELLQNFPRGFVFRDRSVFRRNRNQRRKAPRARLERFVGKRRVIRRHLGLAQTAMASHAHDLSDRKGRCALAELEPSLKSFAEALAGRQPGIRYDHAREFFRKSRHQPKSDQAAPILAEERDVREARRSQPVAHPLYVSFESVIRLLDRLVRAPEAHEVRRDRAMPARGQARDDTSIEKS